MSSSEEKLIQRLLKIWSDSNFTGSFSGIKNFQNHLLFEKNLKVKRSLIRKALNGLPEFSTTITKKHKFLRRHYSVTQSRELGKIDYAELSEPSEGFTGNEIYLFIDMNLKSCILLQSLFLINVFLMQQF